MRLSTSLPRLDQGEGNFYSHNTGGEHATKFSGLSYQMNPLFQEVLVRKDGQDIQDIPDSVMMDMFF